MTDETLALWFTPDAIREHFEGDSDVRAEWVRTASDEDLRAIGANCLDADSLYNAFRDLLRGFANEQMGEDWDHVPEEIQRKLWTVVAVYADQPQRYATTVEADSAQEAERLAREEAEAPLLVAAVIEGEVELADVAYVVTSETDAL